MSNMNDEKTGGEQSGFVVQMAEAQRRLRRAEDNLEWELGHADDYADDDERFAFKHLAEEELDKARRALDELQQLALATVADACLRKLKSADGEAVKAATLMGQHEREEREEEKQRRKEADRRLSMILEEHGKRRPSISSEALVAFCQAVEARVKKGMTDQAAIVEAWREEGLPARQYTSQRSYWTLWNDWKRRHHGRQPTVKEYDAARPPIGRPPKAPTAPAD